MQLDAPQESDRGSTVRAAPACTVSITKVGEWFLRDTGGDGPAGRR